ADGQSEHMIQTLEVIMRARVIDFGGSYHLKLSIEGNVGRLFYGQRLGE
ncbi:hypothetical protein Tco_0634386, partial [Tanacetum coccineum]